MQGRATEDQKEILGMRESQVMLSWVDDQTKHVCKSRTRKDIENGGGREREDRVAHVAVTRKKNIVTGTRI